MGCRIIILIEFTVQPCENGALIGKKGDTEIWNGDI